MLMSKSRLEKFLYALYSLDSSNLPKPLSRIEELYNCLVTGEEVPTFEPLSRVEKYLMAILGVYDADELPNPISRVEVLLYKLATGDDNLDDVKSFLSEHEELLAEIIRNGGVGGNIDIEYVLHTLSTGYNTLYNTTEKPVKSVILKGNTLVNLQEKGTWVIDGNLAYYSPRHKASVLKTNTKYIIYFTNLPSTAITCYFDYGINYRKDILDNRYSIFTTGTNISRDYYIHIYTIDGGSFTTEELANCHVMIIEYQDGMENWDIPYFEGMQSVKMPVLTTSNGDATKSNILTTNEEVTLRGIGGVKDELNLLTGELTQRIGEVVLDGSESWKEYPSQELTNTRFFYCGVPTNSNINTSKPTIINNRFASLNPNSGGLWSNDVVGFGHLVVNNAFRLRVLKSTANTINELKEYLNSNPIVVQYELAEKSIKTVDLSVVNQDGNDTKLSTFNDITHVTLSSEGLIPEAELEVATKNEEDLEDSSVYATHTLSEEFNTLYNTAEKPVKSAILKGNTMINYAQITSHNFDEYRTPVQNLNKPIEKGKIYTIIMNIVSQTVTFGITTRFAKDDEGYIGVKTFNGVGLHKHLYTATDDFNQFAPYVNNEEYQTGLSAEYNQLMILEGDYTNTDIPYFEGMQSVKMPVLTTTGKNLFNPLNFKNGELVEINGEKFFKYVDGAKPFEFTTDFETNKQYTITFSAKRDTGDETKDIYLYVNYTDGSRDYGIINGSGVDVGTITTSVNKTISKICGSNGFSKNVYINLNVSQLEEGSIATSYEPHKSNILTTSEEVELRGIGDIKDELNLLTGELTQRIEEAVLDGRENWTFETTKENTLVFKLSSSDKVKNAKKNGLLVCDKLKVASGVDEELITLANYIFIALLKTKASTIAEFKEYLSQNPITIQYQLATTSIKTVDISTVDQDGNSTKLNTFNDITHVTLSSEGLIPEAELEVAEKVPEVAASMLTISREQEVINATANEQSENVDATMIATTEIYEELL